MERSLWDLAGSPELLFAYMRHGRHLSLRGRRSRAQGQGQSVCRVVGDWEDGGQTPGPGLLSWPGLRCGAWCRTGRNSPVCSSDKLHDPMPGPKETTAS